MKPDVLAQIIEIERSRRKSAEEIATKLSTHTGITITNSDGTNKELSKDDVVSLLRKQQGDIKGLLEEVNRRGGEIEKMKHIIEKNENNVNVNNNGNLDGDGISVKPCEKGYSTGVSEQDKDNEIRRLHRVLLKVNEKMLNLDAPD